MLHESHHELLRRDEEIQAILATSRQHAPDRNGAASNGVARKQLGYEDLIKEYEGLHSNIKIKHDKVGQGGPYHEALLTKLAGGSGAYDVSALEEGHLSDVLSKPQLFNNLEEYPLGVYVLPKRLDEKVDAVFLEKDGDAGD